MSKILFIAKGLHPPWATGEASYARGVLRSLLINNDVKLISTVDMHRIPRADKEDIENFKDILKVTDGEYIEIDHNVFVQDPLRFISNDTNYEEIHLIYPNLLPNKLYSITKYVTKYVYVPPPSFARGLLTSMVYHLESLRNPNLKIAFTSNNSAQQYRFTRKNMLIIPPTIDTEMFRRYNVNNDIIDILSKANYRYGIDNIRDAKEIILYMGWLVYERMPYDIVLDAFKRLLLEHSNALLLIIGRESEKFYNEEGNANAIIREAKRLGIENNISVVLKELNEREKVQILNASNALFLPLLNKRFNPPIVDPPIILLESMACELPVITSNVLSISDVLNANFNDLLIDKLTKDELYSRFKFVLESDIGKELRNIIEKRFSISSVAKLFN
ncbi:MAG: hypothetical protein KatS3mg003_1184 [Candidatus Nitrosocaldaceae archaeon]|nr:MAG: hypothetical protein KatS3mg003_1184 [Candidatus Nitrosocaldaceae archaeon]